MGATWLFSNLLWKNAHARLAAPASFFKRKIQKNYPFFQKNEKRPFFGKKYSFKSSIAKLKGGLGRSLVQLLVREGLISLILWTGTEYPWKEMSCGSRCFGVCLKCIFLNFLSFVPRILTFDFSSTKIFMCTFFVSLFAESLCSRFLPSRGKKWSLRVVKKGLEFWTRGR